MLKFEPWHALRSSLARLVVDLTSNFVTGGSSMKISRIVSAAALIVLIGPGPGVALSQMLSKQPQAVIQAETTPSLPDVQARLTEVGRRLREAKLASFSRPLPEGDYVEAQREVARGDYREAMNHLNDAEQQLDGVPNSIGR
jgi:hypothetical protein